MKFTNEIKVGLTIIVATVIFILGVRYFEDLPLFDKTYDLVAEFDHASGLIGGNIVRVNGVAVGSVNRVYISETSGKVIAEFHVNPTIPVTEGSYATVGGFDALGVTRLELVLGEPDAPRIPEGGMVATRPTADLFAEMGDRAPRLLDGADQVMVELNAVLSETNRMLSTPESDFRRTLALAQGSVSQIERLLASERDRIASILANMDTVTSDIDTALGPDGENVSDLMARLEQTLGTLDRDLEAFSETNAQLTVLLRKLNEGEGTLGMLINDPSMYHRMDSTLTGLNELLVDFRENPARYLKEMKLVDLF